MSEATTTPATTPAAEDTRTSIVDTIFDIGLGWAAYGIKAGKSALEQSAKTLEKTAKALEAVAAELEKKDESKKA